MGTVVFGCSEGTSCGWDVLKGIRRGLEALIIRFEIGDGGGVQFCHDLWCKKVLLKDTFLDILLL